MTQAASSSDFLVIVFHLGCLIPVSDSRK